MFDFSDQAAAGQACTPSGQPLATPLQLRRDITPRPGLPATLVECPVHSAAAPPTSGVAGVYRRQGRQLLARDVPGTQLPGTAGGAEYELIVLSNAMPGREAEYNRWYDEMHLPDVLRNPGFRSAQRFKLAASAAVGGFVLPTYAVRFTLRSNDIDATIAEVDRRLASGVTRWNDAFDLKTSVVRYYQVPATAR